ncbi:hypothetical protein DKAM_0093 [Desulfurococcus amylolyticus 1221n]|uniref:Uncharacterized protein n=1 Tax=Desulfurococcus amylolyticus (strain DSM 18924 / JCM 16383 / VKM B-2413 / 1221n) TaxID=490899 RepID=B8D2Q1_DESA1|nr:hypothetical protein DKAM_0093 [Desulfurococcus amylolyticus 1221n]
MDVNVVVAVAVFVTVNVVVVGGSVTMFPEGGFTVTPW